MKEKAVRLNTDVELKSSLAKSPSNVCFDHRLLEHPVALDEESRRRRIVVERQVLLRLSFQGPKL
jgi:hypothetical protein